MDPRPRPIPRRQRQPGPSSGPEAPPSRFGPYRAAHALETILAELGDARLTRRVARHVSDFQFGLNQLEHVPSARFRKWAVERFAEWYRERLTADVVERSSGRARDAWTHLVCVLTAHARDRVRELNADLHQAWLDETHERRAAAAQRDRDRAAKKSR